MKIAVKYKTLFVEKEFNKEKFSLEKEKFIYNSLKTRRNFFGYNKTDVNKQNTNKVFASFSYLAQTDPNSSTNNTLMPNSFKTFFTQFSKNKTKRSFLPRIKAPSLKDLEIFDTINLENVDRSLYKTIKSKKFYLLMFCWERN